MKQIALMEQNGIVVSSGDGETFEPHRSSFGRSDGNSILVMKDSQRAALESTPTAQPNLSARLNSGLSLRQKRTQQSGTGSPRREQTRKDLLQEENRYLPCHYFDYIGGSSTGGSVT